MKSLSIVGLVLLAIASIMFYLLTDGQLQLPHIIGIMGGIGIGLIAGGIVGYISKGSAIKESRIKKELEQLRKEKETFEKQLNGNH